MKKIVFLSFFVLLLFAISFSILPSQAFAGCVGDGGDCHNNTDNCQPGFNCVSINHAPGVCKKGNPGDNPNPSCLGGGSTSNGSSSGGGSSGGSSNGGNSSGGNSSGNSNPPPATQIPPPPCSQPIGANGCPGMVTGIGDLPTLPSFFISRVFGILIGASGGIALILIIIAGYQLMLSQGKPEAIQQARERFIAAIVGLIFLIFSLVILQVIGVDILHIPGVGAGGGGSSSGGGGSSGGPPPITSCSQVPGGTCINSQSCKGGSGLKSYGPLDCPSGQDCCQ